MKYKNQSFFTRASFIFFLLFPLFVWASSSYVPMESIPGSTTTPKEFYAYTQAIYKFGIWAVGIAALFMITVGGYMYLTAAGNNSSMEKAKGVITDAIMGLILAMTAYLLLYIINPDLVNVKPLTGTGVVTVQPPVTPIGATYTDAQARPLLQAAGINITSSGNCSDPGNSLCTSLEGIPTYVIDDLIMIKNTCGGVTVTGGTEVGHLSHGSGLPVVDLSFNSFLGGCLITNRPAFHISQICTTAADAAYRYNCSTNETVSHLHVKFSS